jgi:DNA polymerase (family 10)
VLDTLPAESRASVLYPARRRIELAVARRIDAAMRRDLCCGGGGRPVAVGSVRRGAATSGDLDWLLRREDTAATPAIWLRRGSPLRIELVYAAGPRRVSFILSAPRAWRDRRSRRGRRDNYRADLFFATKKEYPWALFHHTGSARYSIRVRARAAALGWRLNQYGLFSRRTGRPVRGASRVTDERGIAALLGISYRPPAARSQ